MTVAPKLYKSETTLKLRQVDVNLTRAVISGLGELSGNEIELLGTLEDTLGEKAKDEAYRPEQRNSPDHQVEIVYDLPVSQVQFILNLYSQVKAFTAKDIRQVREVRKRLYAALTAAEITAPAAEMTAGTEEETKDNSDSEE